MAKVREEVPNAYPYITEFKRKPFRSFSFARKEDISLVFIPEYNKIVEIFRKFEKKVLSIANLNLENIYWFLLLGRFLKEDIKAIRDDIIKFVLKCEITGNKSLGFKFSPDSNQKKPDIWSTSFAIAILHLLEHLTPYLMTNPIKNAKEKIINFVFQTRSKERFVHCLNKNCPICQKTTPVRTYYFVIELLELLNYDIREKQVIFLKYFTELKKNYSIVFQLLGLKYLDLVSDVESKHLKYLHQFQQVDGGFSFQNKQGDVNQTFWIVYVLENYSWLVDYNRGNIYSFLSRQIKEWNSDDKSLTTLNLMEIAKIILMLSFIWPKFYEEAERTLFKRLEATPSIDLIVARKELGISEGIAEIVQYINKLYQFNLEILDNKVEFANFLRNLNSESAYLANLIYTSVRNEDVVYLNKRIQEFAFKYPFSSIKMKQAISLVNRLVSNNFFKGRIVKRNFLFFSKYYFYKDSFINNLLTVDSKIDSEEVFKEKDKIEGIKDNIYNIIVKLKESPEKIKEEVKSLILVDDIKYARERLKYNIRNILMEADFLNENVENSFSEDFKYVNPSLALSNEISEWNSVYFKIRDNYKNLQAFFNEIFKEKEDIKNFKSILKYLKEKIDANEQKVFALIDNFKNLFRETLEDKYSEEAVLSLLSQCENLNSQMKALDDQIYDLSHRITSKEKSIIKAQKKIISKWVSIKEDVNEFIDYYLEGFKRFEENRQQMNEIKEGTSKTIEDLKKEVSTILQEKKFQDALKIIEKKTEKNLNSTAGKIKSARSNLKELIKKNRKLYLLFKNVQEEWSRLEQEIISQINKYRNSIEEKVIQQRDIENLKHFDKIVEKNTIFLKTELIKTEKEVEERIRSRELKISELNSKVESLNKSLEQINANIKGELTKTSKDEPNFLEISKLCYLTWEKFADTYSTRLEDMRNKYTNEIIKSEIISKSANSKKNLLKLEDLKKKLKLKCNILIERINDMIDVAVLDGELDEKNKELLVHTENFYKNKQLRSFIERQINNLGDQFGKLVNLYESAIKNKSYKVNNLEIQNRIEDFNEQLKQIYHDYDIMIKHLGIDVSRDDYLENNSLISLEIEKSKRIIDNIAHNTKLFSSLITFIEKEFVTIKLQLDKLNKSFKEEFEKAESYEKLSTYVQGKFGKFSENLKLAQNRIEEKFNSEVIHYENLKPLAPEIREIFVKNKNKMKEYFDESRENAEDDLNNIKNDSLKAKMMKFINRNQILLNQMLGTLERKVEDKLEIKEFKSTNAMVQKRVKQIQEKLKEIESELSQITKKFKKSSPDFETKNKFLFDDFKTFIVEYTDTLDEKIKSLERLILKNYVQLVIKAVKDEYLTLSFLSNELKFKKDRLQTHIITLIGTNDLRGKYDPELQIYYENAEIIENLDPAQLKVIKTTNFKFYEFMNRLKFFASQYSSILSLIAALFTITLSLFQLSGGNPLAIIIPAFIMAAILIYFLLRRQKQEKI